MKTIEERYRDTLRRLRVERKYADNLSDLLRKADEQIADQRKAMDIITEQHNVLRRSFEIQQRYWLVLKTKWPEACCEEPIQQFEKQVAAAKP